jgi:thiamine pyrophosphate-dependent acetolactate synthase large subunit-like protein
MLLEDGNGYPAGRSPTLTCEPVPVPTEGVDRVFGNPGTTELPFLAALGETEDAPEYVLGVHEGAVVSMADGYARATGRPAFVSLHVAAGLANGLIGLLNARRSRTPLVVTAGQQDRRHLQQDPMLSGDLVGLATPAVKAAYDVQHARDLPLALRRAFALARRPPAGPVFLSIPMDVFAEDIEVEVPARTPPPPPGPAPGIERAAVLPWSARRRPAARPCTTTTSRPHRHRRTDGRRGQRLPDRADPQRVRRMSLLVRIRTRAEPTR